jgi:hypothetical protein
MVKDKVKICNHDDCPERFNCHYYYAMEYRIRYLKNFSHIVLNILFLVLFALMFLLGKMYG